MIFLKKLKLINFCNYENAEFDFSKNGEIYKFIALYGSNGIGKSSLLEAITLLTGDYSSRPIDYVRNSLLKFVRNENYDPFYSKIVNTNTNEMVIEGTYSLNNKDYIVTLTQDGFVKDELSDLWGEDKIKYKRKLCHFISVDSDLSMHRFQIYKSKAEKLKEVVSVITGYEVECSKPIGDYYTDISLIKKKKNQSINVHFKRMSAGEKKICKSFSELLNIFNSLENPIQGESKLVGWPRILIFDNCDMHVYFTRAVQLVSSIRKIFSEQQIFISTHSGTLIERATKRENDYENELWIDLEEVNGFGSKSYDLR